ncbi:MAG: DUF1207 domain-containing protein [Syntrophothermus sp.]
MRKLFLILLMVITNIAAQETNGIKFFPEKLNIQPFAANILEPRLGTQFDLNNNELRLNISNSLDLARYESSGSDIYSIGADLFTYTLLRSETAFHFPVDAVDYLFGLNFGYRHLMDNSEYGIRARLSHISAHFADGHFDGNTGKWKNGMTPRVYSREFIELLPYYGFGQARVYVGLTYIYHIDPAWIGKMNYQAGCDYYYKGFAGANIYPFLGYDFKLTDIKKYVSNSSLTAGVKFGHMYGRGVSVYLNYFNGNNIHGEYFDHPAEYSAIGFNLDL